ncbi:DUF1508 domain-containing protein [Nocardia sp. NPDC019395]|uniref:YegP family protein n=1 Tax=Nocardia sp. NPDC019395 TaxID=3154686 RepID=UPI0033CC4DBD
MTGKFVLFTDTDGMIRWRLKAGDGEIIAASRVYENKDSAKQGIAAVQSHATGAEIVDETADC